MRWPYTVNVDTVYWVDPQQGESYLAGVSNTEPFLLFGAGLRKLRMKRNISQERLAELAGLHRNYVGMVERGECNISLVTIIALARALGVKPSKLLEPIR